jgi:O-antigen ligase/Tfp pilus assembly protein PilF
LASLAFVPASFDALNFFDPPKRLIWAMLAAFLAIRCSSRFDLRANPSAWVLLALAGWLVLRSLLRPVPTAELQVLASWCLPVLLFCLGWGLSLNQRGRRIVGGFLVAAALIQAVLMTLQRVGLDPVFASTTAGMDYAPGRMVGTIGLQNQAVDFLALATVGILLITASPAWFVGGAMLVFPAILLTGYRGGIVAFVVGILLAGTSVLLDHPWLRGKRHRFATAAGVVLLSCVLMVTAVASIPQTRDRFREIFTDFEVAPSIQSRLHMARVGWQMFKERPLSGWGAGEYAIQYLDRLGTVLPENKDHTVLRGIDFAREAHNDPLQFAAEFGLVGLVLLVALAVAGWLCLSRERGVLSWQKVALVYLVSYMSVAGVLSFPWQSAMAGPLAAFLLGLAWPRRPGGSPAPRISRWTLTGYNALVLLLAIGLLGWFGRDAYLNLVIPAKLAAGDTTGAARQLLPVDYRYHALVGASLAAQGQDDAALVTLRHARSGYRDVLLWNNTGHVLTRKGLWPEAKVVYEAWTASGLDHARALHNLSIASEHVGDFPSAAESLQRRMILWPEEVTTDDVKRLAVLQMRAGEQRAAAETLRRYRAEWQHADAKTAAELENLAGTISLLLGEKKQAAEWFRSALERYPALQSARKNLEALEAGGRFESSAGEEALPLGAHPRR